MSAIKQVFAQEPRFDSPAHGFDSVASIRRQFNKVENLRTLAPASQTETETLCCCLQGDHYTHQSPLGAGAGRSGSKETDNEESRCEKTAVKTALSKTVKRPPIKFVKEISRQRLPAFSIRLFWFSRGFQSFWRVLGWGAVGLCVLVVADFSSQSRTMGPPMPIRPDRRDPPGTGAPWTSKLGLSVWGTAPQPPRVPLRYSGAPRLHRVPYGALGKIIYRPWPSAPTSRPLAALHGFRGLPFSASSEMISTTYRTSFCPPEGV